MDIKNEMKNVQNDILLSDHTKDDKVDKRLKLRIHVSVKNPWNVDS